MPGFKVFEIDMNYNNHEIFSVSKAPVRIIVGIYMARSGVIHDQGIWCNIIAIYPQESLIYNLL